jgi:hypothetical protein
MRNDERDDERDDELDQLHALRWKLLERADEPGVQRILSAVEQLIDERGADPDCRQRRAG